MKWTRWLFLALLFLPFYYGCSLKRTIIRTEYKIDTVIRVIPDTVYRERVATWTDTVYIENEQSEARAFVDFKGTRIVVQMKGKIFDVPVRTSVIETRESVVREPSPRRFGFFRLIGVWLFISLIVATLYIIVKKKVK